MRIALNAILLISFCSIAYAKQSSKKADGLDKLVNKVGVDQQLSTNELISLKDLKLDNPFIVHLYTQVLTGKTESAEYKNLYMKIIKKENQSALKDLNAMPMNAMNRASEVYLLFKLGYFHMAIDKWIDLSVSAGFMNSPTQVTLEQVIAKDFASEFVKRSFYLTKTQREKLLSLPENKSVLYKNLIALAHINLGPKSLEYIKNLPVNNSLRVELAKSAVISFAKEGELARAASVLKQVFKPYMKKSESVDELVDYYLMLARLLYQANAYDESLHYYSLIPQSSQHFLQARIESLWISYIQNDFSRLKGQVKSLEDELLANKFMPELYLMSSSAKVKLCQFDSAKKTIDQFISVYKNWANKIKYHLESDDPELVKLSYRYLLFKNGSRAIITEANKLKAQELGSYDNYVESKISYAKSMIIKEKKRQWKNREVILSNIIRKMRFVKVEYISLMNRFRDRAITKKKDEIHLYQAKSRNKDELVFPYDGDLWGDDYFNLSADTESACLQGMKI